MGFQTQNNYSNYQSINPLNLTQSHYLSCRLVTSVYC